MRQIEAAQRRFDDLITSLEADRRRAADDPTNTAPRTSNLNTRSLGGLAWPVDGDIIYSFGRLINPNTSVVRWNGIGIAATAGTPVRAVAGGAVELAGVASIQDVSWVDAMSAPGGAAAMMRFGGGLLVVRGLFDQAILGQGEPAGGSDRWRPDDTAFFALAGAAMAGLSFAFDGHTVSKGPRVVHAMVDVVHVAAASVWLGGLVALSVIAWHQRHAPAWMAVLHRFSMLAAAALVAVALAGTAMAVIVLDGPGDLTGTAWGRLLLVKTTLVAVAAAIGGYNHWVIVPASASADGSLASRARLAITAEAAVLLAVAVVTGLLTTASTV
jgi:copper transport protein